MKEKNFNFGFIKVNSIDYLSQASIGKNQKESFQTNIKRNILIRQFADQVSLDKAKLTIDDRDLFDSVSHKKGD